MTMAELVRLASRGQMMPDAPIAATGFIEISASLDKIWEILVDVTHWENWHPYLANAALAGPFVAGSKLTYGGLIKHHLEIAKVADKELVMLCGTMAGYKGITRWDIGKTNNGKARVAFSECSSGFSIRMLYRNEKLADHLQSWLDALKREAERCFQ
ncbi:SRPBCC family protein [Caballeronia sp. LZ043]|uniref:SRPBCC family protein n=1 Tax=Caballeronia sp. LZ043 TaxID=3038569 RepID=UPI0028624E64|nr:hypothetical protein [Caballeronia sp. LZ043]MDR5822350.1 hypothetical protein [Caballeronia sp. LZ043]